jgi:protein SCO1
MVSPHGVRLLLMAAALAVFGFGPQRTAAEIRGADYFTNRPLVTQDGQTVRFWDDLLRDRIVAITFVYTDCLDMCSLSTARMAQLYDWLGERMGRDIFFVSITLDPENDTPEDMKAFAEAFGAGKGWTFLTGTRDDIDVIRYTVGERSRTLTEHRTDMVIGNARTGVWRRTSVMGSLAVALQSILELDPDRKVPAIGAAIPAASEAVSGYDLAAHPGEALFLKACASCHTIGRGVKFAPDLAAVTMRRDRDWLERFLMAPDRMLAEGDPTAVALDADFPGIRMPSLGLGENDVADLIAYLAAADLRLLAEDPAGGGAEPGHDQTAHDHAHDHVPHDHAAHDHATP